MKIYIPNVERVRFYNDGWMRADIELVAEKEKIGFDSGGLWVDVDEESVEEMRRLRATVRHYDIQYGNTIVGKETANEDQ